MACIHQQREKHGRYLLVWLATAVPRCQTSNHRKMLAKVGNQAQPSWSMFNLRIKLKNDALIGFILETQVQLIWVRSFLSPDSQPLNLYVPALHCCL